MDLRMWEPILAIPCIYVFFIALIKNLSQKNNMKILLITVRSDFGGGPRHVDQLIDQIPPNIEIFAAYPPQGEPYGKKWDSNNRIKKIFSLPYRRFSLRTLLKLRKFISENNIDIIHSHGNGAGVYSRLLKFLGTKAKVVHTFHGITNHYTNIQKDIVNTFLGRFFKRFTDSFICVSNGEFALAKQKKFIVDKKTRVIYNGIEDFFGKKIKTSIFNVVTLSRFDYQKNMDKALEIARKLKNEPIQFTWVGDGPDFSRLKSIAEQEKLNINFIGFSKEPIKYMQSASIYLSTARFEGLPYALIEAASVGLPIVATNVVGNNETLENRKTGFLFNTIEEAIEYILQLKNNPTLYQKMSTQSRNFFKNQFTLKKMINKLVEVYVINCQKSNS